MTLAPGHFHAALVQQQMLPGVHPRAYIYAPLGDDLFEHLARVAGFNGRATDPTGWELDVRAGANYFARFLQEQPGNAVVIAGRNAAKIELILAAVRSGLHVLADKPWVIDPADFPKLAEVFHEADTREVVAWDVMTERFEATSLLQRALARDPDVFGTAVPGTPDAPGLELESVHYLKKTVAGAPLRRPVWWFNEAVAGHALADVGTHLADLAMWLLFPDQSIDYRRDISVLGATAWPLLLDRGQFSALTGRADFPPELAGAVANGSLKYHGNGTVTYTLRGVHVRLTTLWEYEREGSAGGPGQTDTHEAVARGSLASVAVRPVPVEGSGSRPELFVTPTDPADHTKVAAAVARRCRTDCRGAIVTDGGDHTRVTIPDALRPGHEAHFASVLKDFVRYFYAPRQIPAWERGNLLAKYYVTTQAVALARLGG